MRQAVDREVMDRFGMRIVWTMTSFPARWIVKDEWILVSSDLRGDELDELESWLLGRQCHPCDLHLVPSPR